MTDILALPNWAVLSVEQGDELTINAEYLVQPDMRMTERCYEYITGLKEILAFFDYPATNGYTEALNGVEKVINRQGRGYTFDVLRAKLLFRKMPDKEHFNHEKLRIMQVNHAVESTPRIEVIVRSNTSQIRRHLIFKYESRCQSCLGVFTPQELWATWLDRKKDFSIENGTILCKPCRDRFDSTQS